MRPSPSNSKTVSELTTVSVPLSTAKTLPTTVRAYLMIDVFPVSSALQDIPSM